MHKKEHKKGGCLLCNLPCGNSLRGEQFYYRKISGHLLPLPYAGASRDSRVGSHWCQLKCTVSFLPSIPRQIL